MILMVTAPYSGTHWLSAVLQESGVSYRYIHSFRFYVDQIIPEDDLIFGIRNPWAAAYSAVNRNHQDLITVDPADLAADPNLMNNTQAATLQVERMERLQALHASDGGHVVRVDLPTGDTYADLMNYCGAAGNTGGQTRFVARQVHASVPYLQPQPLVVSPALELRIDALCTNWGYAIGRPFVDHPPPPVRPSGLARADLHDDMVSRKARQSLAQYR